MLLSVMQCCLDITEIKDLICTELKEVRFNGVEKPDFLALRSLALTAKLFLAPALNALWREQETLQHLFKLLPSTLWDKEWLDDEGDRNKDIWCEVR